MYVKTLINSVFLYSLDNISYTWLISDTGECIYDEWTSWSTCSATCGLGIKDRTKTLSPDNINPNCNTTIREEAGCYQKECSKYKYS